MCVCQRPSTKKIAETERNPTLFYRQADEASYTHTISSPEGGGNAVYSRFTMELGWPMLLGNFLYPND